MCNCRDFLVAPVDMKRWKVLFLTTSLGKNLSSGVTTRCSSLPQEEHLVETSEDKFLPSEVVKKRTFHPFMLCVIIIDYTVILPC